MFSSAGFTPEALLVKGVIIAFFLLVAFPVHEFFHAFMAYRLGDGTAKMFGKLTLNPIAHFHPIGGTMLVLSVLLTGIPLGFAATPVNPSNLRGRYGEAYVSAAGPISNLLLAAAAAIPFRLLLATDPQLEFELVGRILYLMVWGNVILGLFNLIPIPPLDGGAILLSLVPRPTAWRLRPILAQYGFLLLIVIFFVPFGGQPLGGRILIPLANAIYGLLVG
ncbi:MAG TPA: site-2 protease family protein [Candidatus Limnocylindrales bacterium]|nr:site-2 protease family protein [Candidatus Limnocylindrales bacterium]